MRVRRRIPPHWIRLVVAASVGFAVACSKANEAPAPSFAATVPGSSPAAAPAATPRPRAVDTVRAKAVAKPPVLFIGLDGADWQLLDELTAAGTMPNLAALERDGKSGVLETEHPPLSPIVWTTMMTGVSPLVHEILDFSRFHPGSGEREPITSEDRRSPAIWNLATWAGKSVAVFGLWATYPAEPVAGLLVSDRVMGFLHLQETPPPGAVYPPERQPWAVEALRRAESAVDLAELRRFLPELSDSDFSAAEAVERPYDHPVSALRRILVETRVYDDLARSFLAESTPDLAILYFQGTDTIGHVFAPFAPPKSAQISDADFARYRDVAPRYFAEIDRLLGRYREWAKAHGAVLVVASDHGFAWREGRPERLSSVANATAAKWHRKEGIYVVAGPGIAPARERGRAGVRQIAATLAALAGIPAGRGLAAPPLAGIAPAPGEAIDYAAIFAALRKEATPEAAASSPRASSPTASREEIAKLRALGYIGATEAETAPAEVLAAGSTRTGASFNNEGLILKSAGKRREAAAALERAIAIEPRLASALWNLSDLLDADGDVTRSDELLVRALAAELPDGPAIAIARAIRYQRAGKPEASLSLVSRAAEAAPGSAELRLFIGRYKVERGDCAGALEEFRRAEALAPENASIPASEGVALACLGRPAEAADRLRRALELDPNQPKIRAFLEQIERGGG